MQVYSLATSLLPLYLIQAVHSLSFGLNHLCMISLITTYTSSESRGLAVSIYTALGMGLSLFTGGILGGIILKYSGFPLLFQVFSFFPLIAMAVTIGFMKEKPSTA
jgi:PPP family 3-phenylpropionic acid transporter